jgi:uracil-DNA glycosylase family 4
MKTPLSPEQRQQLATLLTYCREMGGVDFYRGEHDPATPEAVPIPLLPEQKPAPIPLIPEPLPIMPPKSSLLVPPAAIDFSSPAIAPEARAAALQAIRQEIGDCTRCQLAFEGRHKIVFGDGDPNAELLFVGEGPGADEDAQGIPFVGRAGQLLNNMIAAMSLDRKRVYIANIVKCRPPKNRVPEPAEANTCTQFLFQQIGVVRPKLIVALGATAATYLLGSKASLSVLRGKMHDCMGTKLIVTYHPAYLLRDPRQKAETWKDLQLAMKFLNLAPPKRSQA